MSQATSPLLDLSLLGVRRYRGASGDVWCEVERTSSYVVLVRDFYYPSRRDTLTLTPRMLAKMFEEVTP